MLLRAWLFLGLICAVLQMAGFFFVLLCAGWHPGDAVGRGFELLLAVVLIYAPPFQSLLATAALSPADVLFTLPFPFIVWGADELRRYLVRRRIATKAREARTRAPSTARQ